MAGLFGNLYQDPESMGLLGLSAGLLQAGGPQRFPVSFGQALGGGLLQGAELQQAARRANLQSDLINAQTQNLTLSNEATRSSQAAIEALAQRLPPDQASLYRANPAAFIKSITEGYTLSPGQTRFQGGAPVAGLEQTPTMVNVPVPGQPGVTQPTWLRPGQTTGAPVGGPAMPEILNPAVQAAKVGVAQAGRPSVNVNVGQGLAKEIGPMLAESRNAAVGALGAIDTVSRVNQALASGNVTVGPAATVRNSIDQLSQTIGLAGTTTEERLINTRNVTRGLAQFALSARKQLKGQGQVSDYEGKLIQRAEAGEVADFTLPELRDFVQTTDRLARLQYAEHQRMLGTASQNPESAALSPFFAVPPLPPVNPANQAAGGIKRYNPATGRIE